MIATVQIIHDIISYRTYHKNILNGKMIVDMQAVT